MKPTQEKIQTLARRYLKVIQWSKKDRFYVGSAPPMIGHACHGATESEVLKQLTVIVEEWVAQLLKEQHPLPPPTAGKRYSGKFIARVSPDLHRKAALRAGAQGLSLNQYVAQALESA